MVVLASLIVLVLVRCWRWLVSFSVVLLLRSGGHPAATGGETRRGLLDGLDRQSLSDRDCATGEEVVRPRSAQQEGGSVDAGRESADEEERRGHRVTDGGTPRGKEEHQREHPTSTDTTSRLSIDA